MVDEQPNESKPATVSQTAQPNVGPFIPGQETRVAMDLGGIRGVQRRQTITKVILVVIALIAVIALIYAIFPGEEDSAEVPPQQSE